MSLTAAALPPPRLSATKTLKCNLSCVTEHSKGQTITYKFYHAHLSTYTSDLSHIHIFACVMCVCVGSGSAVAAYGFIHISVYIYLFMNVNINNNIFVVVVVVMFMLWALF